MNTCRDKAWELWEGGGGSKGGGPFGDHLGHQCRAHSDFHGLAAGPLSYTVWYDVGILLIKPCDTCNQMRVSVLGCIVGSHTATGTSSSGGD